MSAAPELSSLLRRPDIWRGSSVANVVDTCIETGFAALDAVLPGHGWPTGSLTELLLDQAGIGELSLLGPALARTSAEGGSLALVAPPLPPYAPALQQMGIALDRLLVVRVSPRDALWSYEQILASGAFGAAIAWLPTAQPQHIRRLQVAQQGQRTLAFVIRPSACARQSSAAPLRIALSSQSRSHEGLRSLNRSADCELALRILKRRGAPVANAILVHIFRPVYRIENVDAPMVGSQFLTASPRSVSPA